MTGRSKPLPIDVAFPAGAEKPRLTATHGGGHTRSDHAIWANARFIE